MKKIFSLVMFLFLAVFSSVLVVDGGIVWAEDCGNVEANEGDYLGCLGREIGKLGESLKMSQDATAPLEKEAGRLGSQIKSIQSQITKAKNEG